MVLMFLNSVRYMYPIKIQLFYTVFHLLINYKRNQVFAVCRFLQIHLSSTVCIAYITVYYALCSSVNLGLAY